MTIFDNYSSHTEQHQLVLHYLYCYPLHLLVFKLWPSLWYVLNWLLWVGSCNKYNFNQRGNHICTSTYFLPTLCTLQNWTLTYLHVWHSTIKHINSISSNVNVPNHSLCRVQWQKHVTNVVQSCNYHVITTVCLVFVLWSTKTLLPSWYARLSFLNSITVMQCYTESQAKMPTVYSATRIKLCEWCAMHHAAVRLNHFIKCYIGCRSNNEFSTRLLW